MSSIDFSKLKFFNVDIGDSGIAEVLANRPEASNAMNHDFWLELPQIIKSLDTLGSVRVIILRASGKHFSAGMDLSVFESMDNDKDVEPSRRAEQTRRWVMELQNAFTQLERVRMPIISAVHGACIGGGVDMICATDIRYCTKDAFFTVKETALGMVADLGTLQRIQRLIPSGLARELSFTGRNMAASEALTYGFVNRVFDDQQAMLEEVRRVAKQIAAHSPVAVHGTKEMLNYSRDHSVADSLNLMATWQSGMFQTPDIHEAMRANVENRQPKFDDLSPCR
jgi:enoyl-CoA hydratase